MGGLRMIFLVDSHCHLHMLDLSADQGNVDAVIARAKNNGIQHFLNVCVKMSEFPKILALAESYPFIDISAGLHPNENQETIDEATLIKSGQHKKVIAIGETGLDYFRTTGDIEWQRERFRMHIRAAKVLSKPLIIHTRFAKEDTIQIMKEEHAETVGGVMHCFTEDMETAQKAMEMNFYISFSGIVTFKNAQELQAVAKKIPLDRMLIETDAPYLAPNPYRGKSNEPAYMLHTASYLAALKDIPMSIFAEQTTNNFFNLFKGAVRSYV